MNRVFVAEPNHRYNFAAAEKFGQLIYIADRAMPPFDPPTTVSLISRRLLECNFNPDMDAIVLTGHSIIVAMFLAVALEKYKAVRVLLFDARSGYYQLENISV